VSKSKKRKDFFATINSIYRDISNHQTTLAVKGFVPLSQQIDLEEAKYLVDFLQSGSYIENRGNKRDSGEAIKTLLRVYSLNMNLQDLSDTMGISLVTLYKYSHRVEDALALVFPKGLLTMWSSKDYQGIRNCIEEYQNKVIGAAPVLEDYEPTFDLTKRVKVEGRVPITLLQQLRLGFDLDKIEDSLVDIRSLNYFITRVLDNTDTMKILQALKVCKDKGLYISPEVQEVLELGV
jgi:hypothetical protein